MSPQRILGAVLLAFGAVLLILGLTASDSLADQWSKFFTGRFTDRTQWYLLGGVASGVIGVMLVVLGGRKAAL